MANEALIQIAIAMQLSVVAFLVLFSANSRIGAAVQIRQNLHPARSWGLFERKPLNLIAIGFSFNLIYLIIQIVNIRDNPILAKVSLCCDVLTTAFFVLGSTSLINAAAFKPKEMPSFSGRILFIIVAMVVALFTNWGKQTEFNWTLHIYNFTGYSITSLFLLKNFTIKTENAIVKNYYVFVGFTFWTVLQGLGLLNLDSSLVELIGFSISLLSKGLILFGLYVFSVKIAKQTALQQKVETTKYQSHAKELIEINKLIQEMHMEKDNHGLMQRVLNHTLDSKVLNFDYVIFSEVDKFQKSISHKGYSKSKPGSQILEVENWVRKDGFPLDHHDIMSQTVKHAMIFFVKANHVNGIRINLDSPDSLLDKEVYERFEHHKLDRIFIPLSNKGIVKNDESPGSAAFEDEKIVGIIELGYNVKLSTYESFKLRNQLPALELYFNNVAKIYLRNRRFEEKMNIEQEIHSFEKNSSHADFIQKILIKCTQETQADAGDISFLSLDGKQFWLEDSKSAGSIPLKEIRHVAAAVNDGNPAAKRGIFHHVAFTKQPYHTGDIENDEFYIIGLQHIKSQLSVPLIYAETVLGVISLYSYKCNHFNDLMSDYTKMLVDFSIDIFLRLKLSNAVSSLVIPYSMYDLERIYDSTFERIHKYYSCSNMAIWESEENNTQVFKAVYVSESLGRKKIVAKNHHTGFDEQIYSSHEPKIVDLHNRSEDALNKLERSSKPEFECIIYIPLGKNKGVRRFMSLFSKVNMKGIFPEDKTFFGQLSTKLNLSIHFFHLYNFFDKLTSETYKRDKDEMLEEFTSYIKRISGADILLLFTYDAEQQRFLKAIEPKGNLKDTKLLKRLESTEITGSDFSYSIIANGSQWIENDEQYYKYRRQQTAWKGWGVFEQDFWQREKIKSLAAIKIEFDDTPLGVIFFNYREETQIFNVYNHDQKRAKVASENQALINLLANLIGRAIKISNTFEEERIYLEKRTTETILQAQSETAIGMIHNIKNIYSNISFKLDFHRKALEKALDRKDQSVNSSFEDLSKAIFGFHSDYLLYRNYLTAGKFKVEKITSGDFFTDLKQIFEYYQHEKKKINLRIEAPESVTLDCDRVQFTHVLLNLTKNAIEAFAENIWLKLNEFDSTRQYRIVEVSDDGIGIKDEDRPKIFQQSYTTKKDGTGMGLPVCKNVIEKHGGRIDFLSVHNKNKKSFTTFSIYLPILK